MPSDRFRSILRYIHKLAGDRRSGDSPDQHLLERFNIAKEKDAFEGLIQRHGPMVMEVCLGVLGNVHDAEDVFQATFVVLARKASSIRNSESLGGWLHRVAYRIAVKASNRKRAHERQAKDMARHCGLGVESHEESPGLGKEETRSLLHEELGRLAERFRVPIVLCHFEGKSTEEVSKELGCAAGTIKSRLSRGREMLRERLTRRGLTLSTGAVVSALGQSATAAMPTALTQSTIKAALGFAAGNAAMGVSTSVALLANEFLKELLIARIRLALATLVTVTLIGAGTSAVLYTTLIEQPLLPGTPQVTHVQNDWEQEDPAKWAEDALSGRVLMPFSDKQDRSEQPNRDLKDLLTICDTRQRFDLRGNNDLRPKVKSAGLLLNTGEIWAPVLLTRRDRIFTLVLEGLAEDISEAENLSSGLVRTIHLPAPEMPGEYHLRLVCRGLLKEPANGLYRLASLRAASLSFQVVSADDPMPSPILPALKESDLKTVKHSAGPKDFIRQGPLETTREGKAVPVQRWQHCSFGYAGARQEEPGIQLGTFDRKQWLDDRFSDSKNMPLREIIKSFSTTGPDWFVDRALIKTLPNDPSDLWWINRMPRLREPGTKEPIFATILGPRLSNGYVMLLREIDWIGTNAIFRVEVWLWDQGFEYVRPGPAQELGSWSDGNPMPLYVIPFPALSPGEYSFKVEWVFLRRSKVTGLFDKDNSEPAAELLKSLAGKSQVKLKIE